MKQCFKCKRTKPKSEFYVMRGSKDGLLGKCKDCTRADVKKRALEKHDEVLAYDKMRNAQPHRVKQRDEYHRSERGRKTHAEALKRQIIRHPDKYKARVTFRNAVRDGKIIQQPCEVCGDVKSEGHHPDYSKPLEVKWLCNKHHRAEHKKKAA